MITISNDKITVVISEKGAELQSIQLNGLEYLWQANPAHWNKHSPVLFPIVGELKDGKYFFDKKEYKLPRHGFARDKTFEAEQLSAKSAIFTLRSSPDTLTAYPFHFTFRIEYALNGTGISCTYHVQNISDGDMYFSVGGHPAFKVPLTNGFQYTDYKLMFNNDEMLLRYLLHKGLIADNTERLNLVNKTLPLKQSLFYTDAIVLKHIKSNEINLCTEKEEHGIKFKFDGFPYFGIWAAVDAPFVCLEPWCGIADSVHADQQLVNKEGINKLAANENWQRTWSAELY
jgi:galactose mutarotase-like enzyme